MFSALSSDLTSSQMESYKRTSERHENAVKSRLGNACKQCGNSGGSTELLQFLVLGLYSDGKAGGAKSDVAYEHCGEHKSLAGGCLKRRESNGEECPVHTGHYDERHCRSHYHISRNACVGLDKYEYRRKSVADKRTKRTTQQECDRRRDEQDKRRFQEVLSEGRSYLVHQLFNIRHHPCGENSRDNC